MAKINTELSASSEEMRAEFAKAAAVVRNLRDEVESQGKRTLQLARAEVEALRLEAQGHKESSAALRQKISLTEQARELAAKSGISEDNALRILQRKLELERQIVAAREAQTAAGQAAAAREQRIANPGRAGVALPTLALTPQNLAAMDKAAARTKELRRQMVLAGRGGYNGGMGVLAFSQAVEDMQYGIRGVLNNIPQMALSFGAGAGLAGAISLAAVAGVTLYPHLKRLYGLAEDDSVVKAAEEWRNVFDEASKAAAEFERTARAQLSEAVYAAQINQALRERNQLKGQMSGYFDAELKAARSQRDLDLEILRAQDELAKARGKYSSGQKQALLDRGLTEDLENRRKELELLQAESMRQSEVLANQQAETAAAEAADTERLIELKKQLAMQEANLAAETKRGKELDKEKPGFFTKAAVSAPAMLGYHGIAALEATGGVPDVDRTYRETLKAAEANINIHAKNKQQIEEEIAALESKRKTGKDEYQESLSALQSSIVSLNEKIQKTYEEKQALESLIGQRKKLAEIEAATLAARQEKAAAEWKREFTIQRALAANDLERVRALERQRDIEAEKLRLMKEQSLSAPEAEKKATALVDAKSEAGSAGARRDSARELDILRARATGNDALAIQLQRQARMEAEKLRIMREQNVSAAEAARLSEEKQRLEQTAGRRTLKQEMEVLEMEASGNKAGAKALRDEMQIREDAARFAEQYGYSMQKALAIARQKKALENEVGRNKRERPLIYKKRPDEERLFPRGGARGLDGARGLHVSGLSAGVSGVRQQAGAKERARDRQARKNPAEAAAMKYYERSISQGDEMLAVWKNIGVI